MDELWALVADLAMTMSPARVQSAAAALEAQDPSTHLEGLRDVLGPNMGGKRWNSLVDAWEASGSDLACLAAALRASALVASLMKEDQQLSLAWTGPKTELVPVRSTEQVMLEIIKAARKELFLVSFVNVGAGSIVSALNSAISSGVEIHMLLEHSLGAAESMKKAVPGAEIHIWTEESKREIAAPPNASVHAKCVVADGKRAFITSANLTDFAMEKNIELGVMIEGGREPRVLAQHLRALIATEKIVPFK